MLNRNYRKPILQGSKLRDPGGIIVAISNVLLRYQFLVMNIRIKYRPLISVLSGRRLKPGKLPLAYFPALAAVILLFLVAKATYGQQPRAGTTPQLVKCVIIEGDTFVFATLPTFHFFSPKVFKSKREEQKYTRLVRHVKRVYPYARLAGIKLRAYNDILINIDSEKERKVMMKKIEEELEEQFGPELKKLTFTQGVILLKLIDRETGQTGYDILSELRGTFRAFFWQGIGRLFGYNLKVRYEPQGADEEIEEIVLKIMYGQL